MGGDGIDCVEDGIYINCFERFFLNGFFFYKMTFGRFFSQNDRPNYITSHTYLYTKTTLYTISKNRISVFTDLF